MTQAARVYGESMYALALEEGLTGEILEEMKVIRTLFQENPDYVIFFQSRPFRETSASISSRPLSEIRQKDIWSIF